MTNRAPAALALRPVVAPASLALQEAASSAKGYAANARAENTRKAYRAAWQAFEAWTTAQSLDACPALPGAVASYLAHRADEGARPASLNLYLSAIVEAHRAAGQDAAALRSSAEVRATMAGIRRTVGTEQRQAAPATSDVIRALVAGLASDLCGARDRALLTVGFAGAFRRSELVALDVEDLTFSARGVEVRIRRSKTDQEGAGRTVAVPFGLAPETCPVRALRAWLDVAGIETGAVLRSLKDGRIGARLEGRDVARIVKRAAERAGLDAAAFSGHSLRAGLATSAALAGRSDRSIMAQTGHKSRAMVDRYIRGADAWRDNAAAGLL